MQYIEEVYKKEWIMRFFLMRQIFVFVELFAHGGCTSTGRLYFPCSCVQSTEIFCVLCPSVTI